MKEEQQSMSNAAKLYLAETRAMKEAIEKHYVSPALVSKVVDFAREQGLYFSHFTLSSGLFFLSDGEGYSAEAILKYFEIDTSKLVLPEPVDDPIAGKGERPL